MASGGPIATSAQYEAALTKVVLKQKMKVIIVHLAREGAEQRVGRLLVAAANIL